MVGAICRWMKRAPRADGKGPLPHRMGETEGNYQRAGVVRHSQA